MADPYRGCAFLERGACVYRCRSKGSVRAFHGEESIDHEERRVYHLHFHGGQIR